MGILLAGLLLAMQAVAGVAGAAPSATGTTAVTFTIVPRIMLILSTGTIAVGNVEPGATAELLDPLTTTVRSNTPWSLTASAPDFTGVGTPPPTIPITRLSTRPGTAPYVPMVASPGTATLLAAGQPRGGNIQHVWDYRLAIEWTDVPGSYSTTITYTATGS